MQIDFHHTVTYVLSRMAGFPHNEAEIIAYAAQYVDDANNSGLIKFDNGAMYDRISSVNGTYSILKHMQDEVDYVIWTPFHFLPGVDPEAKTFIEKLVCRPHSDVAIKMVDACIDYRNDSYALHRLGITMHVYADTFAHKGFAGILNSINTVTDLNVEGEEFDFDDALKAKGISKAFPMGHGAALECPDKPYLIWSYKDYSGKLIERNNTNDFMDAANLLFAQLLRYYQKVVPGFTNNDDDFKKDMQKIRENFESFREPSGEKRHERWLDSIRNSDFSFGSVNLTYISKGKGSWKYDALGTDLFEDIPGTKYSFNDDFFKSNWKLFHDALQEHRLTILHDILPQFKICLA
ncbi:MAG: hypothetical protein KU29_11945 [Sulfurovum sp. FS06-10]|nr:MAG: hypothetical protein KU29_11945 [Sulfurovum sp. FS06-10]